MNTTYEEANKVLTDAGFADVLTQKRFVLFKKETRDGHVTKIPKKANGQNAVATDPSTWATFEDAWRVFDLSPDRFDGVGIVLGNYFGTQITGVDMDHVTNAVSGEYSNAEAARAASLLHTYAERSPSGTGVHFLVKGCTRPLGTRNRTSPSAPFALEVYDTGRYFTLTACPCNKEQFTKDEEGLNTVCNTYLIKEAVIPAAVNSQSTIAHSGIGLEKGLQDDADFARLYNGERTSDDESSNDITLMNYLAKYLGRDKGAMISAFKESPFCESKDSKHAAKCERSDYLSRTADSSISTYLTGYTFDDLGNAQMFCDSYGSEFIYAVEHNDWMHWNGTKWEGNAALAVQQRTIDLSNSFRDKCKAMEDAGGENAAILTAMSKHTRKFREARAIAAVEKLSRSSLAQSMDIFDADPMILNCKNGVYDLKSGSFSPHSSAYHCTCVAGVNYNPDAKAPLWNAFINKVLPGEAGEYLQQCAGMAAVGKVYEEAMIFMIGGGSNGKSTIANILSAVFGDYAITLQPDIITATRDGKTPPDFAMVRGKRIVFLSETEEGDRLSTKALKRLASSETISARRLYSMPEMFQPTHTVFYSTNHKPRIGSGDEGTWRRIKEIPFGYKFTSQEKITNFAETVIASEGEGILSWVIEGARKFIQNGCKLLDPQVVTQATEDYRDNEDVIANFLGECCELGDMDNADFRCGSGILYQTYKDFCEDNSYYRRNISDFNNALSLIDGIKTVKIKGTKLWKGVKIRSFQAKCQMKEENGALGNAASDF